MFIFKNNKIVRFNTTPQMSLRLENEGDEAEVPVAPFTMDNGHCAQGSWVIEYAYFGQSG